MVFSENVRIAVRALRANKMRSILTTLGIIIGVAAVIAVVSIVQGLQFMITKELQGVGATYVMVLPKQDQNQGPGIVARQVRLTWEDGRAILAQVPGIRMMTPLIGGRSTVKFRDRQHDPDFVFGVNESWPEVSNYTVDRGRFFSRLDLVERRKVAVVGPKIVDWDEPRVLREVGRSTDRFGHPFTPLQDGERDQGQYDRVLEVLFVSSAVMLISREAWQRTGPFDERFAGHHDDLDFCWRARVAGFRVLMTPLATARHRDAGLRGEGEELFPREQGQPHVGGRGILGPEAAGGAPGASLARTRRPIEQDDVAPAAAGQMIGDARADHPGPDHRDRRSGHAVKTCSGCLKLLNSRALPLGSRRNMVACSPGWPAYRTRGSSTNGSPAARMRPATASNSPQSRMAPKCGIGTSRFSTLPVFWVGVTLPVVWAEIWLPKKSKSTQVPVLRPSRHPRISP